MPNVVNSIGYDLEKVHTGMIVYLVDLWREGERQSLERFLSSLRVKLPEVSDIKAKREFKRIDLVLVDQSNTPLVAFEMKVHNHESKIVEEGAGGRKDYQTRVYPRRIPECKYFLYVTLGVGECYRRPYNDTVAWIRLDEFYKAVEGVAETDSVTKAWEGALREEKRFRSACRNNQHRDEYRDRSRHWNLYFLGFLRDELQDRWPKDLELYPTVYPVSSDTILNFVRGERGSSYIEINQNGRLNLKVNLEQFDEQEKKRSYAKKALEHYGTLMEGCFGAREESLNGTLRKSKTLMSFDIALRKDGALLTYGEDSSKTHERIFKLVSRFCRSPTAQSA